MNRKIIIWYNPNKEKYYYKLVWGFYARYRIGYKNQYNHVVILIIDRVDIKIAKEPLKTRVLTRIINYLQRKL